MLSIPNEFVFHSVLDEGVVWTALPRNEDWTKKRGKHCIIIIITAGCVMRRTQHFSLKEVDVIQRSTSFRSAQRLGRLRFQTYPTFQHWCSCANGVCGAAVTEFSWGCIGTGKMDGIRCVHTGYYLMTMTSSSEGVWISSHHRSATHTEKNPQKTYTFRGLSHQELYS